jgi:hypothetical protein
MDYYSSTLVPPEERKIALNKTGLRFQDIKAHMTTAEAAPAMADYLKTRPDDQNLSFGVALIIEICNSEPGHIHPSNPRI